MVRVYSIYGITIHIVYSCFLSIKQSLIIVGETDYCLDTINQNLTNSDRVDGFM